MKLISNSEKLHKLKNEFNGVFTFTDLKNLFNPVSPLDFQRQLRALEKNNILYRFVRGYYVFPPFSLEILSQRLCENSYLSLASVLAKELVIGTIPQQTVFAVKLGKSRTYKSNLGTIIHLGITPHLFFGFNTNRGIKIADKEKAFLDILSFYQKGFKPYFNIYQDMNLELLDRKKIAYYLKRYRNPRFINFVKGVLNG